MKSSVASRDQTFDKAVSSFRFRWQVVPTAFTSFVSFLILSIALLLLLNWFGYFMHSRLVQARTWISVIRQLKVSCILLAASAVFVKAEVAWMRRVSSRALVQLGAGLLLFTVARTGVLCCLVLSASRRNRDLPIDG